MKILLVIFAFLTAALRVSAQPDGLREVPSRLIVGDRNTREVSKPATNEAAEDAIEFHLAGDCHMRVAAKAFLDEKERKYMVILNNIYGGCRAGGWRSGWVVFEKANRDYQVELSEVRIDRSEYRPADDFEFPKPAPTISREEVTISEVDLGGCIQLAGQSQWIFSNAEWLHSAIGSGPRRERCTERVGYLAIDFDRETLVGWSFASGYCGRPEGLGFSAVKETSSDPKGNRLVIDARYEAVGDDYCKEWRTHAVWLVVPRPPDGYRIDLTSGVR